MVKKINNSPVALPSSVTAELFHLSTFLEEVAENSLIFALYDNIAMREVLAERLNGSIAKPFSEIYLSKTRKDVIVELQTFFANRNNCRGVFIYDVEDTFPESIQNLNLKREALLDIMHPLVFWLRKSAMQTISRKAPDFWAWRSEVFDFCYRKDEIGEFMLASH